MYWVGVRRKASASILSREKLYNEHVCAGLTVGDTVHCLAFGPSHLDKDMDYVGKTF